MTLKDDICSTPEGRQVWQQERSIIEVTEMICRIMEENGITRTALAKTLGKSTSHITELLDGSNLTIRKISDVLNAMGYEFVITERRLTDVE